jgi:hypothetical protein
MASNGVLGYPGTRREPVFAMFTLCSAEWSVSFGVVQFNEE